MPYKFFAKLKIPLIILGLTFLSYLLVNYNHDPQVEQFFLGGKNLLDKSAEIKKARADKIYSILNTSFSDPDAKYAVFVKDLKSRETFTIGATDQFTAASIYKLAVMYKAYDAIAQGQMSPDDVLSANQSDLDSQLAASDPSEDLSADPSDSVVSHTVDEAITLMITISDNYSALLLGQKLRWDNIESFLKNQGINGFTLLSNSAPQTTAQATAQILEKIYRGQAVSTQASNKMEKLLLNQTINDRIPKYLPQNVKVAHKTGELDTVRNDAGIVYGKKIDYIFIFFTDTSNPDDAAETVAKTSRDVFNILEK